MPAIFFALISFFGWGIGDVFGTVATRRIGAIGWFWPFYLVMIINVISFVFMRLVFKVKLNKITSKGTLLSVIISPCLIVFGEFAYNIGIDKGLTAVVAPIAGSYPTLFAVLAFLFFKDPITKQQIIGIVTTLIGIVLLSIFSV